MIHICKISAVDYLVNGSLTQCGDLRNHRTHLLRLEEDPNEKLSQTALDLHSIINRKIKREL